MLPLQEYVGEQVHHTAASRRWLTFLSLPSIEPCLAVAAVGVAAVVVVVVVAA